MPLIVALMQIDNMKEYLLYSHCYCFIDFATVAMILYVTSGEMT